MQAEILSVGTELLLGEITDTNAQYISRRLKDLGIDVYRRTTVGDNPNRLCMAFEEALKRADMVISTGGLGPTGDDITASCLAQSLGLEVEFNKEAYNLMMDRYEKRGLSFRESDRKQAFVIQGGVPLPNSNGTAPGQAYIQKGKMAFILPGPPGEMIPMFEDAVIPLIRKNVPGLHALYSKNLRIVGIGEAAVHEVLQDLMKGSNPSLAPYAGNGQVRLRIAAKSDDEKESKRLIADMEKEVRLRLKEYVYGVDEDTLEGAVAELLIKRGLTISVAESLTGGLLSYRLTNIPGSSSYMKMGMVAYSPRIKSVQLGIPRESLEQNDAVNPEVAEIMARSVRSLSGSSIGVSLTGFAGPSGGTPEEPVGTFYCALSHKDDTFVERQTYPGRRERVRERAAQYALYVIWRFLKGFS